MTDIPQNWRSPDGVKNAFAIQTRYAPAFEAFAELDRIGHLLLFRAGTGKVETIEALVGIGILRRAVTIFTGLRSLFEDSAIDPAKVLARAQFELFLNFRCLAYGGVHPVTLHTPTSSKEREPRARRYLVAAERRSLRARALILGPGSKYPPSSKEQETNLRNELNSELDRLRKEYPTEWTYFGDVTETTIVKHVSGRDEPQWYAAEFSPPVRTVGQLAKAYADEWEYDFLYDVWSAMVHPRGINQDVTVEGTTASVHHPHDPTWFQLLATFSQPWQMITLMTGAKWFFPEMIPQLQALDSEIRPKMESLKPVDFPSLLA